MNIIAPLYLVNFQTNDAIDFGDGIKIYALSDQMRQKLCDKIPSDDYHKNIKETLSRVGAGFLHYLFLSSETDDINKSMNRAHEFLRIMRIIRHNKASISLIFASNNEEEITSFVEYPIEIYTYFGSFVSFEAKDINQLKIAWSHYNDIVMVHGHENRIWYAIFLHEMANQSDYFEMQIIHNMVALECLLCNKSTNISFQISSRIACFLLPKSQIEWQWRRKDMFHEYKKAYITRSKIVHGTLIDETEAEDTARLLDGDMRRILRAILKEVNLIDIFLSKKKLKEYLLSLSEDFQEACVV